MKVIKNKKYAYFSIAALLAGTLAFIFPPRFGTSNATEYTGDGSTPATGEWVWQVNVQEVLNMTIDNEGGKVSAEGDVDQFLRDKVTVNVSSNNGAGFTAGMTTKADTTELKHESLDTNLPTLASSATCTGAEDANCQAFAANHWGYSLDYTEETQAGTYNALVGAKETPITIASSPTQASAEKEVFFGAKADKSQASGTYKGTVIFTVTSGTNGSDLPAAAGPQGDPVPDEDFQPSISPSTNTNSVPTYTYTTNNRTYRSTATSIADATVSADTGPTKRSTASDFVSPLGVNQKEDQTFSNIQHGSIVTTILMVVALIAAGVGFFLFILARRRDREEEDEIQEV